MRLRNRSSRVLVTMLVATALLCFATMTAGCSSSASTQASTGATGDTASSGTSFAEGGSVSSAASAPSTASATAQPKKADVQAFVDKAVAYARINGKDAALQTFTAPGGEFHQGQLYIYAYDFNGNVIAHGGDKTLVGKNLLDMKDPTGVPVIQELVKLAKSGSGWLYYTWANPANANKQEPKLGYVVKVDDTWFLGSGTYGPAAVKP